MRLWYVRRAVPWRTVTGAGVLSLGLSGAVHVWPEVAAVLLPFALAAGAAGAGFLLDEDSAAVVAVTPRGGAWRLLSRLGLVWIPVTVVVTAMITLPGAAVVGRWPMAAAGTAACLLVAGAAAALGRLGIERPGPHLATATVGVTGLPFVLGPVLGLPPVFPLGPVPGWVPLLWWGVGLAGAVLLGLALRGTAGPRLGSGHEGRGDHPLRSDGGGQLRRVRHRVGGPPA